MKKSLLVMLVLALLVAGCGSPAETLQLAASPIYRFDCSVSQGFNFQEDRHDLVGFVHYLKFGDDELPSDLKVIDPQDVSDVMRCPHCGLPLPEFDTDVTGLIDVFGVLSDVSWDGGHADPLRFSIQVSTDNRNRLAKLLYSIAANVEIEIGFTVYDYDPVDKKYYKCFHSNGVRLKGLLHKQGGELDILLNMEQSTEVVSPKNFTLTLGVMPQDEDQEIHVGVSVTDGFTKKWGVAVG